MLGSRVLLFWDEKCFVDSDPKEYKLKDFPCLYRGIETRARESFGEQAIIWNQKPHNCAQALSRYFHSLANREYIKISI